MKQKKGMTVIIAVLNIVLIGVCVCFSLRTDRKAPVFSFEKSGLVYQEGMPQTVLLEGITAWDEKDGDVTDRIVLEKTVKNEEENTITVFYAVSDRGGNIVKTSRVFPADFQTLLASGERGLWTEASFPTLEKEAAEGGLGVTETAMDSQAEAKDKEEKAKSEAEKKLEEERTKLEEEAKKLEEEKQALTEERKQLEEQKRQQAENERQAANAAQAQPAPENQNAAETKPKDQQPAAENAPRDKGQKPVITLKAREVNTTVGNPPAWVNLIQSLKDDRDNYETLFYSLSVSKYDLNKAGSYPVTLTVTDSDGNVSSPVALTIHVG